jgi:hypothetical protein
MRPSRTRSPFRPTVECLDDRLLPSTGPIIPDLPAQPTLNVSTVPANGDNNPYGVAFVPENIDTGLLHPGDILVADFNSNSGIQGTGSTIMSISPSGQKSVFFQGPTGLGLTTALGILPGGFVLVGSLPSTTDQMGNTTVPGPGALLVINSQGQQVASFTDNTLLDGPWDLAVGNTRGDRTQVFVSNVLNGTVSRLTLTIPDNGNPPVLGTITQIGSGYAFGTDPAALVVGPTGLAFNADSNTLYVASTKDNAIYAIHNASGREASAGKGHVVVQNSPFLHGPLGLTLDANGDLIAANGDAPSVNPNEQPGQQNQLVEFTPSGRFVGQFQLDPGNPGAAFGVALQKADGQIDFAAVNDNTNSLEEWTIKLGP